MSNIIIGTIPIVGGTFQCEFWPRKNRTKTKPIIYDVVETKYHYVLGTMHDDETFTIEYIFHYTEFAKVIEQGIVKVILNGQPNFSL